MYITKPYFINAMPSSRRQRITAWGIIVLTIAVCIYAYFYTPAYSASYPKCVFYQLSGLHCPGCGTLRGSNQLLHTNVGAAFSLNPLMVLTVPWLIWTFLSHCKIAIRGRSLPKLYAPAWSIWTLFAVIIAFWVLRNIPVYPLTLLAP